MSVWSSVERACPELCMYCIVARICRLLWCFGGSQKIAASRDFKLGTFAHQTSRFKRSPSLMQCLRERDRRSWADYCIDLSVLSLD